MRYEKFNDAQSQALRLRALTWIDTCSLFSMAVHFMEARATKPSAPLSAACASSWQRRLRWQRDCSGHRQFQPSCPPRRRLVTPSYATSSALSQSFATGQSPAGHSSLNR